MTGIEALLRQNNPDITAINIVLRDQRDEPSDADLAQALEENPFITEIDIDLEDKWWEEGEGRQADWHSLLRVIATRANLEKVKWDAITIEGKAEHAGLVRVFLQAMKQNTATRRVLEE